MRDRNMEVKMLREELQQMREAANQGLATTPPVSQTQPPFSNVALMQPRSRTIHPLHQAPSSAQYRHRHVQKHLHQQYRSLTT